MTIQNRVQPDAENPDLIMPQMESLLEVLVLQAHQNSLIEAKFQQLVILEGIAWITMDSQDYVGKVGDCYLLVPTQDFYPIRVSALGGRPLIYSLKRIMGMSRG